MSCAVREVLFHLMQKNSKNENFTIAISFQLTGNTLPLRLHLQVVDYITLGWCNHRP